MINYNIYIIKNREINNNYKILKLINIITNNYYLYNLKINSVYLYFVFAKYI